MSVNLSSKTSWTTRRLWTEAIYRVTSSGAVIDRRAVIVDGYVDLDGRRSTAAESIGDLERDRVDASIKTAVALTPQLDRLAIRCDHNVVDCIAVSATGILRLIAGHLLNNHTAGDVLR